MRAGDSIPVERQRLLHRGANGMRARGLSLVELMIVITLIVALMVMSLPMLSNANAEARSVVCRQNLADMGGAITGYILDHDHVPSLVALPPHQPGLSLPELVQDRLHTPQVLYCPSDETGESHRLGTSYHWAPAYNGMQLNQLMRAVDMPMLTDRMSFHQGAAMPMNELVLQQSGEGAYYFTVTGLTEEEYKNANKQGNAAHPPAAGPHAEGGDEPPAGGGGGGSAAFNPSKQGKNHRKPKTFGPGKP